jgi:hypothetical protein
MSPPMALWEWKTSQCKITTQFWIESVQ